MNTGIFYLYEYSNTQKLRNAGFLKITRHYHSCTLQFHARGIPVSCTDVLNLCAFYLENGIAKAAVLAEITCASHAVSARLNTAESQFPDGRPLPHIDGFLLPLPGGTILAASTSDAGFDTRRIQFVSSKAESTDPPSKTSSKSLVPVTTQTSFESATSETTQNTSLSPKIPETEAPRTPSKTAVADATSTTSETAEANITSITSEVPEADPSSASLEAATTDTTSLLLEAAEAGITSISSKAPKTDTASTSSVREEIKTSPLPSKPAEPIQSTGKGTERPEPIPVKSTNQNHDGNSENPVLLKKQPYYIENTSPKNATIENSFNSSASQNTFQENVRKIQRSELSILPRKYWGLAGNSFLMHGYHNYNHLLLIEEDGHYWLGVPGIYDARESRAAELFGFPQFTDSYNEALDLSEDEYNASGTFGYWCRYLK